MDTVTAMGIKGRLNRSLEHSQEYGAEGRKVLDCFPSVVLDYILIDCILLAAMIPLK